MGESARLRRGCEHVSHPVLLIAIWTQDAVRGGWWEALLPSLTVWQLATVLAIGKSSSWRLHEEAECYR